jgi:hypothetical protein
MANDKSKSKKRQLLSRSVFLWSDGSSAAGIVAQAVLLAQARDELGKGFGVGIGEEGASLKAALVVGDEVRELLLEKRHEDRGGTRLQK